MRLEDDGLTWFFLRMCLRAKSSLFDHLQSSKAVFLSKYFQKCHFLAFLRHFTSIYGIEMGVKHNSMFWNSDVCVSGVQFPIFWQFLSYYLYTYTRKTKKMVKNAILTAFYGIKWYWIMTGWPTFMHECVIVPDYHYLTIFWP